MSMEKRKVRGSRKEINDARDRIKGKGKEIKETAGQLVSDKKQLSEFSEFFESLDLPAEDKGKIKAFLAQQEGVLEKTFEDKVDKQEADVEKEMKELEEETKEYADASSENAKKMDRFLSDSGRQMDTNPIKQAREEQTRSANDYLNMNREIAKDREEQAKALKKMRNEAIR